MVDTTQTTTEKKLTQSDIRGVFLRSNLFQGSWNFERMQALGFCFSRYRQFVASTLRTTKLVNKLFAVTWSSLTPSRSWLRRFSA